MLRRRAVSPLIRLTGEESPTIQSEPAIPIYSVSARRGM